MTNAYSGDVDRLHMQQAIAAMLEYVERIYGTFHDAKIGFFKVKEVYENAVQLSVSKGQPREQALNVSVTFGKGHPDNGKALHKSRIGERIKACEKAGTNEVTLSNMCLISIYAFWEDKIRNDVADAMKVHRDCVRSDLFGDIRHLRNIILHDGGIMDKRAAKIKILTWFSPGQQILLTSDELHEIVELIRALPEGLWCDPAASVAKKSPKAK